MPSETPVNAGREAPIDPSTPLIVGHTEGFAPKEVTLTLEELTKHAVFLGGTGSGKTTAALTVIEQVLLRGVPVILVDRKGDLCSYAHAPAWERPLEDAARAARRDRLRRRLNISVHTPGDPRGRSLTIPLLPPGMKEWVPFERGRTAKFVSSSLCGMMDLGANTLQAILQRAIELLTERYPSETITLDMIIQFISSGDDRLIEAIHPIDKKHCKKITESLQTLLIQKQHLIEGAGATLDFDRLLGKNQHHQPGKTSLTLINTQFLASSQDVDFWMAQFLMELKRWLEKNARPELQAVLMLDEADKYLPASNKKQPATKEPLEDLLRRARAKGLGIFMAPQNPGDMDYKGREQINTWFVGHLKDKTSFDKIKPLMDSHKGCSQETLTKQGPGRFHLLRAPTLERLKVDMSLIRPETLTSDRILELARAQAP